MCFEIVNPTSPCAGFGPRGPYLDLNASMVVGEPVQVNIAPVDVDVSLRSDFHVPYIREVHSDDILETIT